MVKDAKSIARALRCSASTEKERACLKDECPWFYRCSQKDIEEWEEEHPEFKELKDDYKADFYSGCDCDQICKDAADFIENSERAETAAVHQYNLKDTVAWWECENCGTGFMIWDDDRHNFCPKCGRAIKEWKKVEYMNTELAIITLETEAIIADEGSFLRQACRLAVQALENQSRIVHCKDCKWFDRHFNIPFNGVNCGVCMQARWFCGEEGYCLYGTKKEVE